MTGQDVLAFDHKHPFFRACIALLDARFVVTTVCVYVVVSDIVYAYRGVGISWSSRRASVSSNQSNVMHIFNASECMHACNVMHTECRSID